MDNRAKILGSALRLFASHGYDGVGVQAIVEAAGVTKPTLYHYFGSKQGVLEALLKDNFDRLRELAKPALAYEGDLTLTLRRVVGAYFQFAQDRPAFYRMQLAVWFAPPSSDAFKAVARYAEEQNRWLEELFVRATRENGNMRGRQQAYAATFQWMINTYIGLWLNGHTELDDRLIYQSVHQFMHGILS